MASLSRYLPLLDDRVLSNLKMTCYVCIQTVQLQPEWKQEGPSKTCLLCNNPFCEKHKGKDKGVCEIGHEEYFDNPDHHAQHAPVKIFPTLEARNEKLGNSFLGPR